MHTHSDTVLIGNSTSVHMHTREALENVRVLVEITSLSASEPQRIDARHPGAGSICTLGRALFANLERDSRVAVAHESREMVSVEVRKSTRRVVMIELTSIYHTSMNML